HRARDRWVGRRDRLADGGRVSARGASGAFPCRAGDPMSGLLAAASTGYELRSYQQHAVDRGVAYLTNPAWKGRNGLIVLPTGSGKSLVIAGLATRLNEPVLVFQPSKEILQQNAEKLRGYGYYPGVWSA